MKMFYWRCIVYVVTVVAFRVYENMAFVINVLYILLVLGLSFCKQILPNEK